jgi:RNA polymerase sigma-70 factor (ECF subfamily)
MQNKLNLFTPVSIPLGVEMLLVTPDQQEELPVKGARQGEAGAWEILFKRYQLPLYTYVNELIHHEQASLDIVQESFISAARHIQRLREDQKFGSWLFGIAHQKCAQHWRKQRPEIEPPEEAEETASEETAQPDTILMRAEDEEKLMQLLEKLPPPHRAVLILYVMEEFSIADIALITGIPPGTVKSRLHYAKSELREILSKESL